MTLLWTLCLLYNSLVTTFIADTCINNKICRTFAISNLDYNSIKLKINIIMEKLLRKTGINQSLRLLLIIASFVFGSSAWGQTTTTIFSETFDKCNGKGGNDNTWKGITTTPAISADNTGWTNVIGYGASNCARFGTKSAVGSATTPTLNFKGDATLTFRAGAWSGDKTTLNISITSGTLSQATVTLKNGAFTEYSISITGVTSNPKITFSGKQASKSRFFLDDVTVTVPSFNIAAPTYYKKITSTDELVLGTQYIIANIEQGKGLPASGTITTVATISEENKENITDNTLVKSEYVADFAVLTLQKDENDNYVLINEEGQYLTGANGTDLYWKDRKENFSTWNISFDKSGNALIETTVAPDSKSNIMINSNSIKYYASSNNYTKVQLYQKVTDLAISPLTNGYATFVTDVPYVMPKGACGYAVTVAPHVGVITKTEAYTEGQKVPAQTALLIGGASGTYYPAVLKENVAPSYTDENYMEGKRTEEGYTDTQKGVAVYYYKLALNSASKPGFYYGAADGAAFKLTKPTTAYLAVPKSITPVNGYLIDFDGEETGISTIAPTNGNADGAIYNLNGIRMTQTLRNLPKGVYIVNGKKVIK